MSEEQACLVRARSDSETSSKLSFGAITRTMTYAEHRVGPEGSGEPNNTVNMAVSPPEHNPDTDSGELLDYNDASVLEQFHEDALRQAGCGLSQARVVLASGLANMGAVLELAAIPFILPSAEMELCILPHEKNWLVLISLVGCSLGSVGWGVLCERLGRRRTLLSCLAVNAVFAAIAAVMPTYGTFMMARFCSAIGSGGIVPTTYTYTSETSCRGRRHLSLAALLLCGGVGAWLAHALAEAVLPLTGATTLIENKEHFSAWHRYLLLCTLPILASLISLIWTPESPRFLLDSGREVDAMMVYQNIHSGNQVSLCGRRDGVTSAYRVSELTLPAKRRPPALHHVRHSVKMFWQSFFQLFSSPYRATTLSLGGIMLFTLAIQFYLSSYIPSTVLNMEHAEFEASKTVIDNTSLTNEHYNRTLENIEFTNVTFRKCVFRDALMSHVAFRNCSFENVAFLNIKTSYTAFEGCFFFNSTIIDTDMELGRELDEWCVLNATTIRGMQLGCARRADLTSKLSGMIYEQTYIARATLVAAGAALLPQKMRPLVPQCLALFLLSPAIYFARTEHMMYILEAVYRMLLTLVFFTVCVFMVDAYPANLRCTALGLALSVSHMFASAVRGAGPGGPAASAALCAALAAASTALAARR